MCNPWGRSPRRSSRARGTLVPGRHAAERRFPSHPIEMAVGVGTDRNRGRRRESMDTATMRTSAMISTDSGGALVASSPSGKPSPIWERGNPAWWWAAGAVGDARLGLRRRTSGTCSAAGPTIRTTRMDSWSSPSRCSCSGVGSTICPGIGSREAVQTSWVGWAALAAVLATRFVAYEQNWQWAETATLLPTIFCLTWTFGGAPLLRRAWPAILFLVFMLPLPTVRQRIDLAAAATDRRDGQLLHPPIVGILGDPARQIIDLKTAMAWSRSTWRWPATG